MPKLCCESNKDFLDVWSLGHVLVGIAMASFGAPRALAYAIVLGTEIVEHAVLKPRTLMLFQETPINVISDIGLSLGAYELTRELQ